MRCDISDHGGRDQREHCPAARAAANETARSTFSADGARVERDLPGADDLIVVPNRLRAPPKRRDRRHVKKMYFTQFI